MKSRLLKIIVKSIVALAVVAIVVYLVFAGPALLEIIKYRLNPQKDQGRLDLSAQLSSLDTSRIKESISDNWFYYPKLNIQAPVQWDIGLDKINKLMVDGLVHVKSTAKPGENGDILLSGHSSYYFWVKGNYKTVLAPLPQAQKGDKIIIRRQDSIFLYEVKNSYEIRKTDSIEFVAGGEEPGRLLIMTCVPVGTDINRLIVEAELVEEISI